MNIFKLSFSLIITGSLAARPEQIHIALAGDDGIRISWFTAEDSINPYCLHGTSPDALADISSGICNTFPNIISYVEVDQLKRSHTSQIMDLTIQQPS